VGTADTILGHRPGGIHLDGGRAVAEISWVRQAFNFEMKFHDPTFAVSQFGQARSGYPGLDA
jgi:hypothetical protein